MRLARVILCALLVLPGLAQAGPDYPMLHDVTGVAGDDALNVRAAPTPQAPIVGTLAHDQTAIEVLAVDASGKWGRVNVAETSGWASMRYLAPRPNPGDYALAQVLQCFGTEPFWTLDLVQGRMAALTGPHQNSERLPAGLLSTSENRTDHFVTGLGKDAFLVVSVEICSDGMSDRQFGLAANLVTFDPGLRLRSGCCRLIAH